MTKEALLKMLHNLLYDSDLIDWSLRMDRPSVVDASSDEGVEAYKSGEVKRVPGPCAYVQIDLRYGT